MNTSKKSKIHKYKQLEKIARIMWQQSLAPLRLVTLSFIGKPKIKVTSW
ncbi:hypothetical protein CCACVL1_22581 [Corchorus capsularis]|uniref:Uncharacterized protein n=1 Tax=Corchorus capsularis TaxID=210143 RepID=A0A1R3GY37_COCAP|nr:hypothetical protein CCACVL1_22581 [Corchorus capsularis]